LRSSTLLLLLGTAGAAAAAAAAWQRPPVDADVRGSCGVDLRKRGETELGKGEGDDGRNFRGPFALIETWELNYLFHNPNLF